MINILDRLVRAPKRASARSAIMSVVFLSMSLMSLIAAYNVYDDWEWEFKDDVKRVLYVAETSAEQQNAKTMAAEVLLRSIALSKDANEINSPAFYSYISKITNLYPGYVKFGVLLPDGGRADFPYPPGNIPSPPEIVRKRAYFKELINNKRFVVGERVDLPEFAHMPSIVPMALPVLDDAGQVAAILVAVLDLGSHAAAFKVLFDNYETEVLFFDREHKLAYCYPYNENYKIGLPVRTMKLKAAMESGKDKVSFVSRDPLGREKLYAMVKIRLGKESAPYMYSVAITPRPTFMQFITSSYLPMLTGIVLSFLISLWLAARAGHHFFSAGLEALALKTRRVEKGDLSEGLDDVMGCKEIQILAEGMNSMLESIKQSNEKLKTLSNTDGLTGIYNRRHFYELAAAELNRASRNNQVFSIAMADLDRFKLINDSIGHAGGDAVLRSFATLLKKNLRKSDIVARFGGEEFIVLMPETDLDGAVASVEKIRGECAESAIAFQGKRIEYTVSFGVCSSPPEIRFDDEESSERLLNDMIEKADKALYTSKNEGRNRITACRD